MVSVITPGNEQIWLARAIDYFRKLKRLSFDVYIKNLQITQTTGTGYYKYVYYKWNVLKINLIS